MVKRSEASRNSETYENVGRQALVRYKYFEKA